MFRTKLFFPTAFYNLFSTTARISVIRQVQTDTGIKHQGNALANELLQKGFIELTDETLREYLRITVVDANNDYINGLTMEN